MGIDHSNPYINSTTVLCDIVSMRHTIERLCNETTLVISSATHAQMLSNYIGAE